MAKTTNEKAWYDKRKPRKLIVPHEYGATGEIILETLLEQYIKDMSAELKTLKREDDRMFHRNCLRVARKMHKDVSY